MIIYILLVIAGVVVVATTVVAIDSQKKLLDVFLNYNENKLLAEVQCIDHKALKVVSEESVADIAPEVLSEVICLVRTDQEGDRSARECDNSDASECRLMPVGNERFVGSTAFIRAQLEPVEQFRALQELIATNTLCKEIDVVVSGPKKAFLNNNGVPLSMRERVSQKVEVLQRTVGTTFSDKERKRLGKLGKQPISNEPLFLIESSELDKLTLHDLNQLHALTVNLQLSFYRMYYQNKAASFKDSSVKDFVSMLRLYITEAESLNVPIPDCLRITEKRFTEVMQCPSFTSENHEKTRLALAALRKQMPCDGDKKSKGLGAFKLLAASSIGEHCKDVEPSIHED